MLLRRKQFLLTTSFLALVSMLLGSLAQAQAIIPRAPDIAATSYILIDAKTGQVLVEENPDEPLPPASLTKIMTSYIAIEEILTGNLSLNDMVHISEKAWRMEGSKMFVEVNTQVSVEDLLRGIIIQSGNDASVAIAEHIAGSEEAFADMMNQYAEVLGLQNSFFMNSSGLDTELYYNTIDVYKRQVHSGYTGKARHSAIKRTSRQPTYLTKSDDQVSGRNLLHYEWQVATQGSRS